MLNRISICFFSLTLCFLVFSACSLNFKPQTLATSTKENAVSSDQNVTVEKVYIGTNTEPEKIIIYNQGHSMSFEKGTTTLQTLKDYIYQMISEKSENDQLKLAIINGDVSELTKQFAIEFIYSTPVEFRYPDGSKHLITKLLIGSSKKSNYYITAPVDKGKYAEKIFAVQTDSSYEELLRLYSRDVDASRL